MKKTMIIIISILIILMTLIIVITKEEKQFQKQIINNVKTETQSFTLTDNGTEIDVKLINKNDGTIIIREIIAILYDSADKKITSLKYNKEIKLKKEKTIKIISKEKYSNTATIKYKLTT